MHHAHIHPKKKNRRNLTTISCQHHIKPPYGSEATALPLYMVNHQENINVRTCVRRAMSGKKTPPKSLPKHELWSQPSKVANEDGTWNVLTRKTITTATRPSKYFYSLQFVHLAAGYDSGIDPPRKREFVLLFFLIFSTSLQGKWPRPQPVKSRKNALQVKKMRL